MAMIPFVMCMLADELLYSWIFRLMSANGILTRRAFEKMFCKGHWIHADGFGFARGLLNASGFAGRMAEVYLKNTLYPLVAPMLSWQQQEHILTVSREAERTAAITPLKPFFEEIKVCPACIRAGPVYYLHRDHLPEGVTVCAKHRCKLVTLPRSRTRIEMKKIPDDLMPEYDVTTSQIMYANFISDALKQPLDCTLSDVKKLMADELHDRGFRKKDEYLLRETFLEEGMVFSIRNCRGMLSEAHWLERSAIMPALFGLFQSWDKVISRLQPSSYPEKERFLHIINDEEYDLVSGYRRNILEIRHISCGNTFLMTSTGFLKGYRCPVCNKLTTEERFRIMFDSVNDGEYEMLTPFISMVDPLMIRHNCGYVYRTKPRAFYFDGRRCLKCAKEVPDATAKSRISDNHPEFLLVRYKGTNRKAVFLHRKCGRTFEHHYYHFCRHPYCRACHPTVTTTAVFKKQVKDLVGDEYMVNGEYIKATIPITMTHQKCGRSFTAKPVSFKSGKRCPSCTKGITFAELQQLLSIKTGDHYRIIKTDIKHTYVLIETSTGKQRTVGKRLLLQEIYRPTHSEILQKMENNTDDQTKRSKQKAYEKDNGPKADEETEKRGASI